LAGLVTGVRSRARVSVIASRSRRLDLPHALAEDAGQDAGVACSAGVSIITARAVGRIGVLASAYGRTGYPAAIRGAGVPIITTTGSMAAGAGRGVTRVHGTRIQIIARRARGLRLDLCRRARGHQG